MAFLSEWPWYWRYPGGLAIVAVCLWLAASIEGRKPEWVIWLIGGGGTLVALWVMREVGCLVVILAVVGAVWFAFDAFFPDAKLTTPVQIGLTAAFAYYAWYTGNKALLLASENKRTLDNIWQRLNRLEETGTAHSNDLYTRLHDAEMKLRRLDGNRTDF